MQNEEINIQNQEIVEQDHEIKEELKEEINKEIKEEIRQELEQPKENLIIVEVEQPQLTQEQQKEEMKKIIREKAIEEGKSKHAQKIKNYYQPNHQYIHSHHHLCPSCQRKKQRKKQRRFKNPPQFQYMEYPYYPTEEEDFYQYEYEPLPQYDYEEQYEIQEPLYDNNEYQYQENENIVNYGQPKYDYKTYQPRFYNKEERAQLIQKSRPMFTVLSFGNNVSPSYNTYTEPTHKKEIIPDINKDQTDQKQTFIKKEEKKEKTEIKHDVKKVEKVKERKEKKRDEKKVEKKIEIKSKFIKRGGNNEPTKTEKVRQSSVNRYDKGKRHHVTYEVINVHVEKKK